QVLFSEFADFYVGKHVIPLLESEWQSRHPETALLDVNTRFAVASLWVKIGSTSSASRMLDEIERRYQGRSEMLVGYPIGSESTLREAVACLRSRPGWAGCRPPPPGQHRDQRGTRRQHPLRLGQIERIGDLAAVGDQVGVVGGDFARAVPPSIGTAEA